MTRDETYMRKALELAEYAGLSGEVPVGAVIVKDNELLCGAHNFTETRKSAAAHAELLAIQRACEIFGDWRLSGCELFVTLEPCAMCAGAILNARIRRVVFGAFDPAAGCFGSVADLTRTPQGGEVMVLGGVLQQDCTQLLNDFFKIARKK